jgi:hypothetical protein
VEVRGLANVLQDLWLGPDSERQLRESVEGTREVRQRIIQLMLHTEAGS